MKPLLLYALLITLVYSAPENICFKSTGSSHFSPLAGIYELQNFTYNNKVVYKQTNTLNSDVIYISYGDIVYNSETQSGTWGFRKNSYTTTTVIGYYDKSGFLQNNDCLNTNPGDCKSFIPNTEPSNTCDAELFSFELETGDYVWLGYSIVWFIVLLCFVLPFGICNKFCKEEYLDGVTQETYDKILEARGYKPESKGVGDDRTLGLLVLRGDLSGGKTVWHDNMWKDFLTVLRQEHGLISAFYCATQHPYNRRSRKIILATAIMLDLCIAIVLSYLIVWKDLLGSLDDDGFGAFVFDNGMSLIFGLMLSIIDTILVSAATCACVERCPNCCRKCAYCLGNAIILCAIVGSIISLVGISIVIGYIASQEGSYAFWGKFALNFVTGLFQGWFLMDLIELIYNFNKEWRVAHIKKPENAEEEEKEKKSGRSSKIITICLCLFCWWFFCLKCMWCSMFCKKKEEEDQYDHGSNYMTMDEYGKKKNKKTKSNIHRQDDFGVNYFEYNALKNGTDIGDRELNGRYALLSLGEVETLVVKKTAKIKNFGKNISNKFKEKKEKTNEKMNEKKEKVKGLFSRFSKKNKGQELTATSPGASDNGEQTNIVVSSP